MSRHIAKICAYGLVAVLSLRMLVSVMLHPLRIGWDPALHLQCAQLIVEGGLPYVDMFDVNPPLIWYLDTLPALLSAALNQPVTLTFNLFMVALMVLSGVLCVRLVLHKLPDDELLVNIALIFGLLYFNFFLAFDFGQREEIFVLLYMPFLFLRYCRYRGASISRREAVATGVVGGMGICLKHYFLIDAVFVELFLFLFFQVRNVKTAVSRLFAAETFAAVIFAVIYIGHFLLLPPVVKENYFGFLVPAFAGGYQFWDTCLAGSLAAPGKREVFFLLAAGVLLTLPSVKRAPLLGAVAAFALSGLIPYLLQFKGWNYQDIPAYAGAVMLLSGAVAASISYTIIPLFSSSNTSMTIGSKQLDSLILSGLVVLSGASIVSAQEEQSHVRSEAQFALEDVGYKGSSPWSDIDSPFVNIMLANASYGDAVLFMSNAVAPGFPPLTQLRMKPASRHLHCCILSVLQYIKEERPKNAQNKRLIALGSRVIDEYKADIKRTRPVLIFIQDVPVAGYLKPYKFDQILKDYKKIDQVAGFTAYKRQVR